MVCATVYNRFQTKSWRNSMHVRHVRPCLLSAIDKSMENYSQDCRRQLRLSQKVRRKRPKVCNTTCMQLLIYYYSSITIIERKSLSCFCSADHGTNSNSPTERLRDGETERGLGVRRLSANASDTSRTKSNECFCRSKAPDDSGRFRPTPTYSLWTTRSPPYKLADIRIVWEGLQIVFVDVQEVVI